MDKYIKENKIATAIIVILVIAFGMVYFYKQTPKTETNLSLQTKCSDMALKFFNEHGYKTDNANGDTYTNHYNSKLNKCFILLSSYMVNDDFLIIDLIDVLEGKTYADFSGHNICDPTVLTMSNQKLNKCQLDAGNIWFDGDSTRSPADYHVGFQGYAVGPGIGDENTQKQFLEHVQPFMNN